MVSTMPSAVSGLTKQEAPSAAQLAEQRLGGRVGAGGDHLARAFVADGHRLAHPCGHHAHPRSRDVSHRAWAAVEGLGLQGREVGGAQQQSEVRRIERRGVDAHQHLVGRWGRRRDLGQRQLQAAAGRHQGAELQARRGNGR
jgi:hypothetical protein